MIRKLLLTVLIIIMLSTTASAKVYLVIAASISTGDSNLTFYYHEMSNMDECNTSASNAKLRIPNGGDAETAVVLYCTSSKAGVWSHSGMVKRGKTGD